MVMKIGHHSSLQEISDEIEDCIYLDRTFPSTVQNVMTTSCLVMGIFDSIDFASACVSDVVFAHLDDI